MRIKIMRSVWAQTSYSVSPISILLTDSVLPCCVSPVLHLKLIYACWNWRYVGVFLLNAFQSSAQQNELLTLSWALINGYLSKTGCCSEMVGGCCVGRFGPPVIFGGTKQKRPQCRCYLRRGLGVGGVRETKTPTAQHYIAFGR